MGIFHAEEERAVRELLAEVERTVELALVLGPFATTTLSGAREVDPEEESRAILAGIAELCDRVVISEHGESAFGAERYPAIVVLREGGDGTMVETGIRFYGTPWGYELTSLVGAVLEAGKPQSSLSADSLAALAALDRDLAIEVFVTPT
jgi:alkyl hydroperoxide reductase subunit AhpF